MPTTLPLKSSLNDLDQELAVTRRVLERIPEDRLTWKPHPRSMSIGVLSQHLATLVYWMTTVVEPDEYDLATNPDALPEPESKEAVLEKFDRHVDELKGMLAKADDAALSQIWVLRHGEQVFMKEPRVNALRSGCISHMVHHRGQLCVYLRLLDIPVPSVYGPSADES